MFFPLQSALTLKCLISKRFKKLEIPVLDYLLIGDFLCVRNKVFRAY